MLCYINAVQIVSFSEGQEKSKLEGGIHMPGKKGTQCITNTAGPGNEVRPPGRQAGHHQDWGFISVTIGHFSTGKITFQGLTNKFH